jgi:hypothetical protein
MKPSSRGIVALILAGGLGALLFLSAVLAQAPGGFIEKADSTATRPVWTASQIQAFLPERGKFTFPPPYNTEGIRLTNDTDCGGTDCVLSVGDSYWRNTNNHRDSDTMLIFLGLRGVGPTLFSYTKSTGQVQPLGPLFDAASPLAQHTGEGWYFSATQPTKLYVAGALSPKLLRYDALTKTFDTVFDATTQFGEDKYISQTHSSDDDKVHSATLTDLSSHAKLGCLAYREGARQFSYYAALNDFGECQIDKSGRWLLINEDLDGVPGRDNLIVDLESGAERVLRGEEGAGGRADTGHGYMVAADSGESLPGPVRIWDFDERLLAGPVVYHTPGGAEHITHSNAQPGVPPSRQYACAANATTAVAPRANEIVCFRLDGSPDVLVVTQSMTDLTVRGGGDRDPNQPMGNLDVTGRYFIWVSNMGGNRADAFMVEVPAHLLTGTRADATTPTDPSAVAAPGSSLNRDPASPLAANAASLPNPLSPLAVTAAPPAGTVDTLALFNPSQGLVSLIASSQDLPPVSAYTTYAATAPVQGQWVMGDWDGNGIQTPAVYGDNGAFYYTNDVGQTANWTGIWFGFLGHPPVAGRFDAAIGHDCLGVVDSAPWPGYGTAFAVYFTCALTSGANPAKVVQWLGAPLPDSAGFSGLHQFAAGDFDGGGVDSLAVRRGPYVAWTNVSPMTLSAPFNLAQYVGAPAAGYGNVVAGDWDGNALDSFGLFYPDGRFYRRDDLEWNSGLYTLQRVGQPIGTPVTASAYSPGGIAALFPGDAGIETHPDVVLVERFEEATLANVFSRWTDIRNGSTMSLSSDVPPASLGTRSLDIPWTGGGVSDGGHLYKRLTPGVDDTLYVRYYIKYPPTGYRHDGIWMGGYNPPLAWPNPQAGLKPAGNDRFAAAAEQSDDTSRLDHYDYWMDMHRAVDGNYWGNTLLNNPSVRINAGQWTCVEQMVRLNNPVTAWNGEHAIWIDGVKVSHLGQGFPNGQWSGGNFTQNPIGSPFEGFRWRNDPNLKLNYVWLQTYAPDSPAGFKSSMKFDHVVVAKSYIGCLTPGTPDTIAPAGYFAAVQVRTGGWPGP